MYSEIVDLSILIENNMIYYPGDPEPELSKYITLEKDGCQVMKLNKGCCCASSKFKALL